jgi:predicted Zn-dependent protease
VTSSLPPSEALRRRFRRRCFFVCRRPWALDTVVRLLVALGLLGAAPLAAQEPGGRLISIQGQVEVLRGSRTLPATVGLLVQAGDVIRSGATARAAILLSDGTQLKLAPNSTIQVKQVSPRRPGQVTPAAAGGLKTILQFFLGEGWLRSTGPADQLEIETPAATVATKGTEFALAVAPDGGSTLAVVEGLVRYANPQGAVLVAQGEQASAQVGQAPTKRVLLSPLDAVQWSLYYPGTISSRDYPGLSPEERAELEAILTPYRAGRLIEATERLAAARAAHPTAPALLDLAALLDLVQGQVPEANAALAAALQQDPTDAAARALLAEIALVQNRKAEAEAEAERAIAANRAAPSAWLALSHVRQAQFRLEQALQAAEQARALDPQDLRALVQMATLLFGMDRIEEAWDLAQRARALAPAEAMVLSLLGFLQLARGETEAALASFRQASAADSTLGQPHLGAGLALFRLGQVAAGVEELQAATLLDSQVSLYESYLGKGLYQAGWRQEGLRALARAQALDPRDPTPHLYRGIFLADLNRPAESIQALQEAVALNDNRGVYRSRLLLDRDLATKNVDLARSYRALGQTERARLTAIKSIEEDPSNSAAHFLFNQVILAEGRTGAGTFRAVNRERLLTRLLLPVNQNSFNTFNDYTTLLEQPRLFGTLSAQVNAEPEGHNLELLLDGGTPQVAFRQELTQIEDQGFKPQNDDLLSYSTFTLAKVATGLRSSLLIDGGYNNFRFGDKSQDFAFFSAPNDRTLRDKAWSAFGELGYQIRLTPESELLLRASTKWEKDATTQSFISQVTGAQIVARQRNRNDFLDFQALYLLRAGAHRISLGVDYLFGHQSVNAGGTLFAFTPPLEVIVAQERLCQEFLSPFIQDTWLITPHLRLTGALHFDYARDPSPGINQFTNTTLYSFEPNPQFGLTWELTSQHTIRAAVIRSLVTGNPEAISPTQIAGFLVEESPTTSTRIWQAHLAWDAALRPDIFLQATLFYLDRDVPLTITASPTTVQFADSRRLGGRLTLEQLLPGGIGLSLDYQHVRRLQGTLATDGGDDDQLRAKLRYVHPSGFMAGWRTLYAHQTLDRGLSPGAPTDPVFHDLFVAYELPQKRGLLAVGVDNLFNQRFNLVSDFLNISSEEFPITEFIRDRIPARRVFVFGRVNF